MGRIFRKNHADASRGGQRSKTRRTAAFVDAEHALDPEYAKKDWSGHQDICWFHNQTMVSKLWTLWSRLVRSGVVDVVVVDSVAALVPKAEIEGEMGDQHVGRPGSSYVSGA